MIDYIRIEIKNTPIEILSKNNLLNFSSKVNIDTGELIIQRHGYLNQIAMFKNLKIEISTNLETNYPFINLTGSIHKFAQNNTNHQDFNFNNVTHTLNEICNTLHLNPSDCIIHHIEFGLNINPVHSTKDILDSMIMCKGIDFEKKEFKKNGYLKSFEFSQYKIKVYDKALQYDLNNNLLRFEVKVSRMQYLQNKGIKINSLAELLNCKHYTELLNVIISNLDNILFYDFRIEQQTILNKNDSMLLLKGNNPLYWIKLKKKFSPNTFYKKKNEYIKLVELYAPSNLKDELKNIITSKWNYLLNNCTKLPDVKNNEVVQIYTNIVSKIVQTTKHCLTCGKDISHQRKNSKYCRFKINGKENKDCKNRATNFFEHDLKMYPKQQFHLFEIDNYLHPDKLRLKEIAFKNYRLN